MNRFVLAIIILNMFAGLTFAKEIEVKIKPTQKVTSAKIKLMEGDVVNFEIVSPKPLVGKKVTGMVTSLNANNWASEEATLLIENFKLEDGRKLNGLVYKKGNPHNESLNLAIGFLQFLGFHTSQAGFMGVVRGGEAQLKNKNEFTLYLEENDEKSRL